MERTVAEGYEKGNAVDEVENNKHNNCSLNRKCFCCKGIFLGQRSKTYNHVIMMSPVHMSASPLLLCHVF